MKNIIGTPARGDDFLQRGKEIRKITKGINEGANIQLAAPRRVGKTSILMYLLDNKIDGHHYIYVDTEAIDNSNDYFKKLYSAIVNSELISGSAKAIQQLKEAGNSFLRKIKSLSVSGTGIELNDEGGLNYYVELTNLLKGIKIEDSKLVVMIDEFPYTLNNIIEKTGSKNGAITLLQENRTLRQDPEINLNIQFIYTGSIGLNTTVENIDATALINDILSIKVLPISFEEGEFLISEILKYEQKIINPNNLTFLLKRVEWLTPFYIKLIIKEIVDLMTEEEKEITDSIINDAFSEIIDYRNNNYFEHYYSRLKGFFSGNDFKFIITLLNYIVKNNTISKSEIFNIATKHNIKDNYKTLIHTLIYDGYIHSEDDNENYRFNSPILKLWWKKYITN